MILEPSEHNKPITIHLVEYPNNPGYAEEGDFRITVYNQGRGSDEKDRPLRKKYDWWVKLESVDGGLLSTNDTWLYEAPSSGYQNSLRMEEKGSAPDWKRSIEEKKIYFKTHGNYGSANIRIITHVNGSIGVYMKDLFINPTGSRNLEYDQYKRIQVKHNFK